MEDEVVHRWLESDNGGLVSIVTVNPHSRLNIDGELRCSWTDDCFAIPCTLSRVARMSNEEIIGIAERAYTRRKNDGCG